MVDNYFTSSVVSNYSGIQGSYQKKESIQSIQLQTSGTDHFQKANLQFKFYAFTG